MRIESDFEKIKSQKVNSSNVEKTKKVDLNKVAENNFVQTDENNLISLMEGNDSTSAKGLFCCVLCAKGHTPLQREVHRPLCGQIKFKWEVPKSWLMMQESRLLSYAPSASREITTQRKTRRMIRTGLSLRNSVSSAASTLFTKSLSDWEV